MTDSIAGDIHSADELGQYRSLSPLAVLALLLGLAAPLVLTTPVLSIIPVAGIAVAIIALVKIHTAEGSLTGSFMAKAGLALCVCSLMLPQAKNYIRDSLALESSSAVAEQWIANICEGKEEVSALMVLPKTLYDITIQPSSRNPPGNQIYSIEDGIAKFKKDFEVAEIAKQENSESFTLDPAMTIYVWKAKSPEVLLHYNFTEEGKKTPNLCKILLERRPTEQGTDLWFVKRWDVVAEGGS